MNPTLYYRMQQRSNVLLLPYVNATNLALAFTVSSGSGINVDWGDGVIVSVPTNGANQTKTFGSPTTGVVTIYQPDRLTTIEALAAYPFWSFNLPNFQRAPGLQRIYFTGNIGGNINNIRSITNYLIGGTGNVVGVGSDIRPGTTSFVVTSTNSNIQTTDTQLQALASLAQFRVSGNSKHIGNIGLIPAVTTVLSLKNTVTPLHEITYTSKTWASNMRIVELLPAVGFGLNTSEVDTLLINLAATTWTNEKIVNIGGNNAKRSVVSDDAKAALLAMGVTLTVNEPTTYYVRPAGTTYGTGAGTSYTNAWSGFPAINTTLLQGSRLAVCGTHLTALTLDGIKCEVIFNDPNQAGLISCADTLNVGMFIKNTSLIKLTSAHVTDAVVSCIEFENTTGTTKDCIVTGSGNQGLQHLTTYNMTHTNLIADDCVDDGISGHDSGIINVVGGSFTNCEAGINVIADCIVNISGNPTFSGNLYDVWAANATNPQSCIINATGCTFPNQVLTSNKAKIVLTSCNAADIVVTTVTGNIAYLTATNSVIGNISVGSSTATITGCRVNDLSSTAAGGVLLLTDSYIKPVGVFDNNGTLRALRCLFDGIDTTDHTIDCNSGATIKAQHSIFINTLTGKYALSIRTGTTIEALEALTIYGVANIGRGIFTQINTNIKNTIITGLSQGINSAVAGQTLTSDKGCLYNNTTPTTGSGSVVFNSSQNTDPLFVSPSSKDFHLGLGSALIGTGDVLTANIGINTASWGDSVTPPAITTKIITTFNIGALS